MRVDLSVRSPYLQEFVFFSLSVSSWPLLEQHRIRQLEAKLLAASEWKEQDLIFCTSFGTPLNPNWVLERFKKLLQKAGLPAMRFHDMRHSIATILLSMGTHPKVVQELLGHNRIQQTVDTYSQVIRRDALQKADAFTGKIEYCQELFLCKLGIILKNSVKLWIKHETAVI